MSALAMDRQAPVPTTADALHRVRVTMARYATPTILLYELREVDGAALPAFTAGAHVDVHLPGGITRQYSLANDPCERDRYVLGIKRDPASRGGSRYLHETLRVGQCLEISAPRNHFPLCETASHTVFIAGGIGVTPIAAMVARARALGLSHEIHYSVRDRAEAALLEALDGEAPFHLHVNAEHDGAPMDLAALVAQVPKDAHLYCCGPGPMLDAYTAACAGRAADHVHLERFASDQAAATGGGYTVQLVRSGRTLAIAPGQTILHAVQEAGIAARSSCAQGVCGACETRVIAGRPDHRDALLSEEEREANDVMMICCSGSLEPVLVLDL